MALYLSSYILFPSDSFHDPEICSASAQTPRRTRSREPAAKEVSGRGPQARSGLATGSRMSSQGSP